LLVQSLGLYDFTTWNTPAWSISTEFYTYLLFALALVVFRRHIWIVLAVAILAGPVALAVFSHEHMYATTRLGIVRCVYGFAAGVIGYHLWLRWQGAGRVLGNGRLAATVVEAAVLVASLWFVTVANRDLISVLAPYIFVAAVVVFAHEGGWISLVLRWRPFVVLGLLSYSIYMVHSFVVKRTLNAERLLAKFSGLELSKLIVVDGEQVRSLGTAPWQALLMTAVFLMIVIALSYVSYRLIEQPGRRFVRRLTHHG
jgi:peptidoglycan/LPS O-acetylase OafA/YrhL